MSTWSVIKVSSTVILYGKLSSDLTFENIYPSLSSIPSTLHQSFQIDFGIYSQKSPINRQISQKLPMKEYRQKKKNRYSHKSPIKKSQLFYHIWQVLIYRKYSQKSPIIFGRVYSKIANKLADISEVANSRIPPNKKCQKSRTKQSIIRAQWNSQLFDETVNYSRNVFSKIANETVNYSSAYGRYPYTIEILESRQ